LNPLFGQRRTLLYNLTPCGCFWRKGGIRRFVQVR
jgi:hypothetical protein